MKLSRGLYILGAVIMMLGWFFSKRAGSYETVPEMESPNRARWAALSASGQRTARLDEIPMSKNVSSNLTLALPQIRARLVPGYAVDGSPITCWASEEDGELHWMEFAFGNRRKPMVTVTAAAIAWGSGYAASYRIMGSTDGKYWKQVYAREGGAGGVEYIKLEPQSLSALRIEIPEPGRKSVSILDVGIYGDRGEKRPAPVKNLKAAARGPDSIQLKWEQADGDAYFFNVYRAEGGPPELTADNLVETTADNEIIDYGLKPGRTYYYRVEPETFGGVKAKAEGSVKTAAGSGTEFARFRYRGVVEGFYNDPWPHQERLRMIAFFEDIGFNYYIYAPKVEPYHRQWWRKPYPPAELKNFSELAACCRAHNITFNYGISPGLDINFNNPEDIEALKAKLKSLFEAGVRAFTICFDDINPPGAGSPNAKAGRKQAELINDMFDFLRALNPGVQLFFVPTVYSRTYSYWKSKRSSEAGYLQALAEINPAVGIMWTGPGNVFSAEINKDQAMELKELWDRPVLIWDNYPVNDISLRFNVFTGPYLGRSLDLGEAVGGIFLNPMYLPNASRIALYTAGKYMTEPVYDPWTAYDDALKFAAGSDGGYLALKALSDCLIFHPVFPGLSIERMPAYKRIEDLWAAREAGTGEQAARGALREMFQAFVQNPDNLRGRLDNQPLVQELMPLSEKLALYGDAGLKCMDIFEERAPDRRTALRRDALQLQARARVSPWKVADESTGLTYSFIGITPGKRNLLDDFINRSLREAPP